MKLYIYVLISGSICTLLYIFFNHILPCELSLKWKRVFLRVNMAFYLLPIPWFTAQIKGAVKWSLEKVGMTFLVGVKPNIVDVTGVWESVLVGDGEGRLLYILGHQGWLAVIKCVFFIFIVLRADYNKGKTFII